MILEIGCVYCVSDCRGFLLHRNSLELVNSPKFATLAYFKVFFEWKEIYRPYKVAFFGILASGGGGKGT